ncbi:MAG: MarR family transcriptional regulator [Bacteroidales bacterium]|nr:MAG: MarR family transcriptional regulator [Bacteroidales bacterium]
MEKDFLKELEFLGVTARIKRLSDSLFYDIKSLYNANGIDIEPSWHLVLLILKRKEFLSMVELSELLSLSKPAVTKMIKKMQQLDYIVIDSDGADNRKKMITLSAKAIDNMPKFEKIWDAGQRSVQQILEGTPYFMDALSDFERKHSEESFSKRALKNLTND